METRSKMQQKISEWKTQLEELNVQLHLGLSESSDKFEELKYDMKKWTETTKGNVESSAKNVRAKFEELEVQLALGKAETEDKFKEQYKKIDHAIDELRDSVKHTATTSEEKADNLSEKVKDKLDYYSSRLELIKMKSNLARSDAKDRWEKEKKEISQRIQQVKSKLDKEVNEERWDHFSSEVKQAWQHLRDAFKKAETTK